MFISGRLFRCWNKYCSSRPLSLHQLLLYGQQWVPPRHTHRFLWKPYPICALSNEINNCQCGVEQSLTQDGLGRYIPSGLGLTSGMKLRRSEVLLCHCVFHLVSTQQATQVSDLEKSFKSFSAAGTNGCLDLRCGCPL